jgi:hypothetical protein
MVSPVIKGLALAILVVSGAVGVSYILGYYDIVDVPLIGEYARAKRFEDELKKMGIIVIEVPRGNTSVKYYTALASRPDIAPPDRAPWWAHAIWNVKTGHPDEISRLLLIEAREMVKRSFEVVAVFQRGGAKMTVEMLKNGEGYGLTLAHYYILWIYGEAPRTVMPLTDSLGFRQMIFRYLPYTTPDEEWGYNWARALNESLTWEDYKEMRLEMCERSLDRGGIAMGGLLDKMLEYARKNHSRLDVDGYLEACKMVWELFTMRRTSPSLALLIRASQLAESRTGLLIWAEPDGKGWINIFIASIEGDPRAGAELAYEMLKNISTTFNRFVHPYFSYGMATSIGVFIGEPVKDEVLGQLAIDHGLKCYEYYAVYNDYLNRTEYQVRSIIGGLCMDANIDAYTNNDINVVIFGSPDFLREFTKVVFVPVANPKAIEWINNARISYIACLYDTRCPDPDINNDVGVGYSTLSLYKGVLMELQLSAPNVYKDFWENLDTSKFLLLLFTKIPEENPIIEIEMNPVGETYAEIVRNALSSGRWVVGVVRYHHPALLMDDIRVVDFPTYTPKSYDYIVVFVAPGLSKAIG